MKQISNKICSFVLAVLLFLGGFSEEAFASVDISMQEIDFPSPTFYDLRSAPNPVDSAKAAEKIKKIRELKGKYFTVNKTYCGTVPGEAAHGCDNCASENLIKTDLYEIMPESVNCLPEYYRHTGGIAKKCWSCAAFASITHWYIYAEKSTDVINVSKISSGIFNAETLAFAKPGDIIALSDAGTGRHYHSMIFLEHTAGGIKVIDCNWSTQTYGNCAVLERNVNYSGKYTAAISRAVNFFEEEIFKVEFKAEEGTTEVPKSITANGTEFTVPENIPQRENWKFLYWSDGEKIFEPGKSYEIFADKMLFAVWEPGWIPKIKAESVFGKPGETVAVYANVFDATEAENTEISLKISCEGLSLVRSEIDKTIPQNGKFAAFYFKIPENAEKREYPISAVLEKYVVSEIYNITEKVEISCGSIFVNEIELGDADCNGKINIFDANLIRRYAAKLVEFNELQISVSDVDGSGNINIIDANMVRRYCAKLIESFPAEQNID